jgi:hypothetical protein
MFSVPHILPHGSHTWLDFPAGEKGFKVRRGGARRRCRLRRVTGITFRSRLLAKIFKTLPHKH